MLISRVLEVREGDTVGAIRRFLARLLEDRIVDRVVAVVDFSQGEEPSPKILADADALANANPLLPVMLENAAMMLREAMSREPGARFAAVMRPCEVRTTVELIKRSQIDADRLVILGLDCLATYDADFYHDVNANHPGDPNWLMHQALRFARVGQIGPDRYRAACQLCDRPAPDYNAVDILIGLIGGKPRERLLVIASEEKDAAFHLERMTDRTATQPEVVGREVAVWRLSERRKKRAARQLDDWELRGEHMQPSIRTYMSGCTLCGKCMEACPLGNGMLRTALKKGLPKFIDVYTHPNAHMASCAGCGMCQTHCPENIPLSMINYALGHQLQAQMSYVPGRSIRDQMPQLEEL